MFMESKKSLLSILTYIMAMVRRIFFIMILILYIFLFIRTAGPSIPERASSARTAAPQLLAGRSISPCPQGHRTRDTLPLLPGTGDEGLHRLYDGLIQHILDDFEPELIINSAGQDNHFSDPLA